MLVCPRPPSRVLKATICVWPHRFAIYYVWPSASYYEHNLFVHEKKGDTIIVKVYKALKPFKLVMWALHVPCKLETLKIMSANTTFLFF